LQFLSFEDEILQGFEEGNMQSLFMRQMPTHDIQKVIFDKNYIKFTQQRQMAQAQVHATIGYSNQGAVIMENPAMAQFQMNRLQYVQYECIKTELKEEYEKRVNFLHKRIEKRQA
jgi:hypothetical protein